MEKEDGGRGGNDNIKPTSLDVAIDIVRVDVDVLLHDIKFTYNKRH
jgi:hypothetical protein